MYRKIFFLLTSLLGVTTNIKKRTSCEFLPILAGCFNLAIATCRLANEGKLHLNIKKIYYSGNDVDGKYENWKESSGKTKQNTEKK